MQKHTRVAETHTQTQKTLKRECVRGETERLKWIYFMKSNNRSNKNILE